MQRRSLHVRPERYLFTLAPIFLVRRAQASDESSITFPPGLDNNDRAVVHAECRKVTHPTAQPLPHISY